MNHSDTPPPNAQRSGAPSNEQAAATIARQFYENPTKRPNIRELLKRLAEE
ncbi:MAG: hypothetical protein ACR2GA_07760 [Chloroflexota bacterium]